MKKGWMHISLIGLFVALILDQGHKLFMIKILGWQGGEFYTVTPFFDYVLVWNRGISYGLFSALPPWGLIVLMISVSLGLLYWWASAHTALLRWGIAITIGGALGNIIDRVFYGAVADFFSLHAFGFNWYIFNIADIAISLGVMLLIYDMVWPQKEK